jgi:hypothetical protein
LHGDQAGRKSLQFSFATLEASWKDDCKQEPEIRTANWNRERRTGDQNERPEGETETRDRNERLGPETRTGNEKGRSELEIITMDQNQKLRQEAGTRERNEKL